MLELLRRFVSRTKVWGVHPTVDVVEHEEYLDANALALEVGCDSARLRSALEAGDITGIRLDEELWLVRRSSVDGYLAHCPPEDTSSRGASGDKTYTAAYAGLPHRH